MGLDMHAAVVVGIKVMARDLYVARKTRHDAHGNQTGKFCQECGKRIETEFIELAPGYQGDAFQHGGKKWDVFAPQYGAEFVIIATAHVQTMSNRSGDKEGAWAAKMSYQTMRTISEQAVQICDALKACGIKHNSEDFGIWAINNSSW